MQFEDVNQPVEILASFKQTSRGSALVIPEIMNWKGRRYRISQVGLRHPTTKGARMLHIFTFAIDETAFELEFDAERLTWQLLRMSYF